MRLRLLIEGDGQLIHDVKEIGHRASDAKPVLTVIQKLMEEGAREQFETRGARGGKEWQPDKDETVKRKEREGFGDELEVRTSETRDSLFGGAGVIRRLSKSSTTFGTRVFQARFQGHRRQLLRLTLHDSDKWSEMMVRWILDGEV
jgi:hypothetical protein